MDGLMHFGWLDTVELASLSSTPRSYLLRPRRSGRAVVPSIARPRRVRGRLDGVVPLRRRQAVFVEVVGSGVGVVGSRRAGVRRRGSRRTVVPRRAGVTSKVCALGTSIVGDNEETCGARYRTMEKTGVHEEG